MADSVTTATESGVLVGRPADPGDSGEPAAGGDTAAAATSADQHGVGEPECVPLKNLKEVLAWNEAVGGPELAALRRPMTPLARSLPPARTDRPRTLVCHDMMGGYLDDRFVQGVCSDEPYSFYHWAHVDVFVYFSHHMVTVPPVGWVNAAHRHAVPILGTFITEWNGGEEACKLFLESEESARALADQLVRISSFYRLDGWFVNIENPIEPEKVPALVNFLRYLRERLRAASPPATSPPCRVLWYDSVVTSGRLDWQNELNDKNWPFFDACDGIFLNYVWTSEGLERSGKRAGSRRADVYVGVDVFGRGVPGRAGYAACLSMQEIWKQSLSAAIFAPGWVYESHERPEFHKHQHRFWNAMVKHTNPHSVSTLPISTSFCRGQGRNLYRRGTVCRIGPWTNLSAQNLQPIYTDTTEPDPVPPPVEGAAEGAAEVAVNKAGVQDGVYVRSVTDLAFEGGGCLLVQGLLSHEHSRLAVRLLSLMAPAPETLLLSYVYRVGGGRGGGEAAGGAGESEVRLGLELTTLDSAHCTFSNVSVLHDPVTVHRLTAVLKGDTVLCRLKEQCGGLSPQGWTHRCYLLELLDCTLQDVFLTVERVPGVSGTLSFQFHMGLLQMLDAKALDRGWEAFSDEKLSNVNWTGGAAPSSLLLSGTLHWSYPAAHIARFRVFWRALPTADTAAAAAATAGDETVEPALLGEAYASMYRIHELAVPPHAGPGEALLEFLVQPTSLEGFVAPWNKCGRVQINYCPTPQEGDCRVVQ